MQRRRINTTRQRLVVVVLVCAAPAAARAQQVQPRVEELANGLKLLMIERHDQPTVAAGVFYDVGSVDDPHGRSGIAHMFEHMMFKGTRTIGTSDYQAESAIIEQQDRIRASMAREMQHMRRLKRLGRISDVLDAGQWTDSYRDLMKQYDLLLNAQRAYIRENEFADLYSANGGPSLNAATAEDFTLYYVQLPSNKLELFFWLESDRMANAVMREFYVERDNVREERRLTTESTPAGRFDEAFEALFWQAHPYGNPVLGWPTEVEAISRADARDFYRRFYTPDRAVLILVGDFDADRAIDLARRYFERIKTEDQGEQELLAEEPTLLAERRMRATVKADPRVRIRFLTVAMGHPDEPTLNILAALLSGKSGRLYSRLVTAEDVALETPEAFQHARKYAGYLELSATVNEAADPQRVEAIILDEIGRLRAEPVSEYELQKIKNQVLAASVQRLRTNLGLMFRLGLYETWHTWRHINELPERMLAVTAEDVQNAARRYLNPQLRTVALYSLPGDEVPVDPELEALLRDLPPDQQANIRQMMEQILGSTDVDQLNARARVTRQTLESGGVPEEQRALIRYLLRVMADRTAELRSQQTQEGQDEPPPPAGAGGTVPRAPLPGAGSVQ